jgi:hypothetical protein
VADTDKGLGNRLTLVDDQLLDNLRSVQLRNGLTPSGTLASGDFTVEMETGTGKTYVYLRTVFELNKRYGFTKFVIVVPSVAIKEGVYKSLQITEEHFKSMYAGVPVDFFLYDSSKLGQVRNFATSATIQIMVVTVLVGQLHGDGELGAAVLLAPEQVADRLDGLELVVQVGFEVELHAYKSITYGCAGWQGARRHDLCCGAWNMRNGLCGAQFKKWTPQSALCMLAAPQTLGPCITVRSDLPPS